MELKWRYFINSHKVLTPFVVLSMIYHFQCETYGAYLYLGMHGTYCMCWLLKELWYPDRSFDQTVPLHMWLFYFTAMTLYWLAPFIITRSNYIPSNAEVLVSISSFTFGMFFHYGSDSQKYFTLKARPGLITDGFFSLTRNPNYLGEILTYIGFMTLSGSLYPHCVLCLVFICLFYPNMKRKDASLSRHEGFKAYKERTWMLFPKVW